MINHINKLESTKNILESDKGFIDYLGESYFYKRCIADLSYRELIAYEIANFLSISSVFYKPVLIPNIKNEFDLGVIAKDYRKENHIYIDGYTILHDYYYNYIKKWRRKDNYHNNSCFNDLNSIWEALDYRYRFSDNRQQIVQNILKDIIKNIFLFDIFTQNVDRNFNNWELDENIITDEVKLNKIYDNEDIFLVTNHQLCNIVVDSAMRGNWYDLLRNFLLVSEGEYLEVVNNIYNKLTPETLFDLILIAEKRHNILIPMATKKEIFERYKAHYEKISIVLKEFNKGIKRVLI